MLDNKTKNKLGGKANSLILLKKKGTFKIPQFDIMPTSLFENFLDSFGLHSKIKELVDHIEKGNVNNELIKKKLSSLRRKILRKNFDKMTKKKNR